MRSVKIVLILTMIIVGCSGNEQSASDTSTLRLRFPKKDLSTSQLNFATTCYAINITGEKIDQNPPETCEGNYGILVGFIDPNSQGEVPIEVPKGSDRLLEIYGFDRKSLGEPCPAVTTLESASGGSYAKIGNIEKSKIYSLGTKAFDALEDEVEVRIELNNPTVHVATQWELDSACYKSETLPKNNAIGSQHLHQTSDFFQIKAQTGYIKKQELSGEHFSIR